MSTRSGAIDATLPNVSEAGDLIKDGIVRPLVVMDSVSITPQTASAGQTGLTGRVVLTNQAGVYRAPARLDSVDINFLLGGPGKFNPAG